jgi:Tfp pilus assembly protein PilF
MNKLSPFFLLLALSWGHAFAAEFDQIGTFDFPTSGSPAAQEHFLKGVGYLHSFGMTQAQGEFRKAQEIQPDFAMAYWGEAFTYQHPFFGQKSDQPGAALLRLGATSEARLAKAPTEREKGFLRAAEAYALTPGGMTERRIAWMSAMADLHAQFPDDDEVKAFYAAALLAGATASPADSDRINMRAGAIALELFRENGDHPGAAHYVIHAFDDPLHAPIALAAAEKYATIAPAVSHARHMPTHIFIQHGMWDKVSVWNHSAFQAGLDLWQPGDPVGDLNHSSDWGQYGDLQLGDLKASQEWIAKAADVLKNNPGDRRSMATLKTMQARHIIESKQWQTRALAEELSADELLGLGLSAANLGKLTLANQVVDQLAALAAKSPNDEQLALIHLEVAALTLHKESMTSSTVDVAKRQEAITLVQSAIALRQSQRAPNGAASPLKPVHELAGEMMFEMGRFDDAAEYFETSLLRLPGRPWSLLGAAQSYAELGDSLNAASHYSALLTVWQDESSPAVQAARNYLNK